MKFTQEDNILTASEANYRASQGAEDSLVRESIRKIMRYVKYRSSYGYKDATIFNIGNYENFEKCPKVKEEIEKLGYIITEESQCDTTNYFIWIVSW